MIEKKDIQVHAGICFKNKEMFGSLWDQDFRDELYRVSSHRDNITLVALPSRHAKFSLFWHEWDAVGLGSVCECGFWKNAWHIDTKGLWDKSQLNDSNGYVERYVPPEDGVLEKIKGNRKYNHRTWECIDDYDSWDGVVLITQKSRDASVSVVGGKEPYYEFIRKACEYYGDKLLLKAHPRHSHDDREETKELIKGTGAKYGTLQDVDGCEFVLLFNSTISGELFVKNIPIVQYAKGYFHNLEAIHFTNGEVKSPKLRDTKQIAEKTAEFLLWKYCIRPFAGKEDVENFTDMLLDFANSKDEFPLKEKYSYASSIK